MKLYAWEEFDTELGKITTSAFAKPWNVQVKLGGLAKFQPGFLRWLFTLHLPG